MTAQQRYNIWCRRVLGGHLALALLAVGSLMGCEPPSGPPLEVVPSVEISRYLGKWYDIASYPQTFQRGCEYTTATYSLKNADTIKVLNECMKNGRYSKAEAVATTPDPNEPAKLKVQFFGPFKGDYWIIDLDKDYEWAVVGHPSRKYLWILSRNPTLDTHTLGGILDRLQKQHYDISKLEFTQQ